MLGPKAIGIISALCLGGTVFVGWYGFDLFVRSTMKILVNLKPGSHMREIYMNIPFSFSFKIYIFNVTNPIEVSNGAIPIVEEIGPYVYEERKDKVFVSENEADDTLTFYKKETYYFRPQLSDGLTGEELVTIPHPVILSMVLEVSNRNPALIPLVNKAIISVFEDPSSLFLTATVNEIFFEGLSINCRVTDFAGKTVCAELKRSKFCREVENNVLKFSFFGNENATATDKFKVMRGLKDYRNTGRVLEFNDQTELRIWGSRQCNQYRGTEGTIFPALIKDNADVPVFVSHFCRNMLVKYVERTKYNKLPVSKYSMTFGDMSTNPEDQCYCPNRQTCWKRGIMDLSKCVAPVLVSLPHFYDSDESYVQGVRGLHPNEEKHEFAAYFETLTGNPLSARNRIQFSLPLTPVNKIPIMNGVPNTVLPIFWVEEGVDLNSTYTKPIKLLYYSLTLIKVGRLVIVSVAAAGVLGAVYKFIVRKDLLHISNIPTDKPGEKGSATRTASPNGRIIQVMSGHEFDKY